MKCLLLRFIFFFYIGVQEKKYFYNTAELFYHIIMILLSKDIILSSEIFTFNQIFIWNERCPQWWMMSYIIYPYRQHYKK